MHSAIRHAGLHRKRIQWRLNCGQEGPTAYSASGPPRASPLGVVELVLGALGSSLLRSRVLGDHPAPTTRSLARDAHLPERRIGTTCQLRMPGCRQVGWLTCKLKQSGFDVVPHRRQCRLIMPVQPLAAPRLRCLRRPDADHLTRPVGASEQTTQLSGQQTEEDRLVAVGAPERGSASL